MNSEGKREVWIDWMRVIACFMVMIVFWSMDHSSADSLYGSILFHRCRHTGCHSSAHTEGGKVYDGMMDILRENDNSF